MSSHRTGLYLEHVFFHMINAKKEMSPCDRSTVSYCTRLSHCLQENLRFVRPLFYLPLSRSPHYGAHPTFVCRATSTADRLRLPVARRRLFRVVFARCAER